jgi:cubilin
LNVPHAACGGVFEEPTGILMSPFYPKQYQSDHNCEYYIVAPLKKAITLHFIDLDFEDSFSGDCSYDSISVYDGHDANATLLGKYCDSVPNDIVSSYNYLHLIFQTDQTIHGRGFKANYSFFDVPCGGIIKSPNTVISPPPDEDEGNVGEMYFFFRLFA